MEYSKTCVWKITWAMPRKSVTDQFVGDDRARAFIEYCKENNIKIMEVKTI